MEVLMDLFDPYPALKTCLNPQKPLSENVPRKKLHPGEYRPIVPVLATARTSSWVLVKANKQLCRKTKQRGDKRRERFSPNNLPSRLYETRGSGYVEWLLLCSRAL
jgi:hypothetical protein